MKILNYIAGVIPLVVLCACVDSKPEFVLNGDVNLSIQWVGQFAATANDVAYYTRREKRSWDVVLSGKCSEDEFTKMAQSRQGNLMRLGRDPNPLVDVPFPSTGTIVARFSESALFCTFLVHESDSYGVALFEPETTHFTIYLPDLKLGLVR